jgi:glucose-6-phosphate isomerase
MTEEQIRELATVAANVRHLVDQVGQLQKSFTDEMSKLVTQAHHDAQMRAINKRVDDIESRFGEKLNEQSPGTLFDKVVRIAIGVSAIFAALGVLGIYVRGGV